MEDGLVIRIVQFDTVRTASEAYLLLRRLVLQRSWSCAQLGLLSRVACLALKLSSIQVDLLPHATDDVECLLVLKNAALILARLCKDVSMNVDCDQFTELTDTILFVTNKMLNGSRDNTWFQQRIPHILDLVIAVSMTPARLS